MAKKVFVTYKYGDTQVQPLNLGLFMPTRTRDYVTAIQDLLAVNDELYKGEDDGTDLSNFQDETIASKLRDKIYDSSITIVIISKGMKEAYVAESDQWVPWEISYSLRETTRNGRTSRSNGMLTVVLPDEQGDYSYYLVENTCPYCNCRTLRTDTLFKILRSNMFNVKNPTFDNCAQHVGGGPVYTGQHSYIESVKWSNFIGNVDHYLDLAAGIREKIPDYNIVKTIE